VPTTTDTSSQLPPFPPGGVTAGVDWASTDHAVAIVHDTGNAIDRFTVTATAPGLRELVTNLCGAGVHAAATGQDQCPSPLAVRSRPVRSARRIGR
jgi:hypothetical protein